MTLEEYSYKVDTHYSISDDLNIFMRKEPKFKEAKIVQEGLISDTFPFKYEYSHSWLVDLNGKLYNLIISEGNWYYRNRSKPGVKYCRYYPDGNKPTRRAKQNWDFNHKNPWELIPVNKGEGKKNDCQIWTVAVCLGITYAESFQLLYANGWREDNARNEYRNDWKSIFESKGKTYNEYWTKWQSSTHKDKFKGSTLGGLLKRLPSTGTFIIGTRGHILAVVDGVIIDSCFNAGNHVQKIYEVINL